MGRGQDQGCGRGNRKAHDGGALNPRPGPGHKIFGAGLAKHGMLMPLSGRASRVTGGGKACVPCRTFW